MTQTIKIKRSGTANKKPLVTDLELGELAVNTFDGKLYFKTDQAGVQTVVDVAAGSGADGQSRPAGALYTVQINGGDGKFEAIPIGDAGRVLTANGNATPTWEPVPVSGGTVRSIDVSGGATGLSFAGGPITTVGTITMSGTLGIANGGTGATTVVDAQAALLPPQAGKVNNMLTTDGDGNLSWTLPPGLNYTTGEGLAIRNSTEIYSTVADNTGTVNRLTLTNGNGTLSNLDAGAAGNVLTSAGAGAAPTWSAPLGTVSDIRVVSVPTMGLRITGGVELDPPVANTTHITTTGSLSLAGVLAIANGGTGSTTANGALNNLLPEQNVSTTNRVLVSNGVNTSWGEGLPPQAGHADNMLVTNGTTASWVPVDAGGTVSSIDASGGTTGLTFTGGPVTTTGTLTLGGTLGVNNGGTGGMLPVNRGGTGATTAAGALTNLLPSQAGNAGLILTTDGTNTSWTSTAAGSVTSVAINPSTTGLTFSGGPITSAGTFTVGGVLSVNNGGTGGLLPIARGGTGQTTAEGAFNALAPTTAQGDIIYRNNLTNTRLAIGTEGQVLTVDATGVPVWKGGTGIVSSVDASGGSTGLTFTGGPITSSGTLTLSGTLGIASGGTGATTATAAFNALAPSTIGNSGKVLSVVGSSIAWQDLAAAGALTSVSGGSTGIAFNPVLPAGTTEMSGVLNLVNGGTGSSTAVGARTNILPAQAGQANKVLLSDGTDVYWGNTPGSGTVTSVDIDASTTGLTFSGGPVTSAGTFLVGGTLNIANGGTGGTSAQQARNNLLPPQATHNGQVLVTDGTNVSWSNVAGTGTVTSVDIAGGVTGLTFSGGPITTNGVLSLGGTLNIANGGTGATSRDAALTALLPTQTGNSGRVLTTNATSAAWTAASALDIGVGSAYYIQYKSATTGLGSTANFTYNPVQDMLTTPKITVGNSLTVSGGVTNLTGSIVSNVVTLGTPAIAPANSSYFIYTSTGATTWTIGAVANSACSVTLKLINGGGFVQTWPSNVYWAGGTPPVFSTGATKFDLIFLTTMDGGTTWQGASLVNFDTP